MATRLKEVAVVLVGLGEPQAAHLDLGSVLRVDAVGAAGHDDVSGRHSQRFF